MLLLLLKTTSGWPFGRVRLLVHMLGGEFLPRSARYGQSGRPGHLIGRLTICNKREHTWVNTHKEWLPQSENQVNTTVWKHKITGPRTKGHMLSISIQRWEIDFPHRWASRWPYDEYWWILRNGARFHNELEPCCCVQMAECLLIQETVHPLKNANKNSSEPRVCKPTDPTKINANRFRSRAGIKILWWVRTRREFTNWTVVTSHALTLNIWCFGWKERTHRKHIAKATRVKFPLFCVVFGRHVPLNNC